MPWSHCLFLHVKGTNTSHPILQLSSQTGSPLLQGLSLTTCGDDISHNAIVVYLVLLGTTLKFL